MNKITAEHLARCAYVYIRQSTPEQVQNNLESQRRQYALANRARELGWKDVEVIDDDLGVSGSGTHRPGFERLLRAVCDGQVGAVFSVEASRLARNGRDWHTLLEFCSIVNTLLVDSQGVYDAKQTNDRLLLGMKGTISEMEVASFRERAHSALTQKAQRGELFRRVPIAYVKTSSDRIEKNPDARVRTAIGLVFIKFAELSSVRQVYFWLCENQIEIPVVCGREGAREVLWRLPRYTTVLSMLKNPLYAGAYAYGQSKSTIRIENGRKRVVHSRCTRTEWTVLIRDHHEGYIDWDVYQSNQALIAHNENAKSRSVRGSVKRGGALLAGLLRCGHCGARIVVQYPTPAVIRYQCSGNALKHEGSCCVMFGGLRADRLVSEQVLHCLRPLTIQAAIEAIDSLQSSSDERIRHKQLALEQARYEVTHARRQYDSVDPANRLVASELERRWNEALNAQAKIENELTALQRERPDSLKDSTKRELLALAQDVPDLWDHPKSLSEHKKHILRAVLKEIIATSHGDSIQLLLHWQGGEHTQLQLPKTRTGHHRYVIAADTIDLVRALARVQPDAMIASILNRAGLRTAHGKSWTSKHVCSLRYNHSIAVYSEEERKSRGDLFVSEVAATLDLTASVLMRLIRRKQLPATQVCANSPWIVRRDDLEKFSAERTRDATPKLVDENQLPLEIQ